MRELKGMKSRFSFTATGGLGEIEMNHLSCYTCPDCKNGVRTNCEFERSVHLNIGCARMFHTKGFASSITEAGEETTMALENTAGIGKQRRKQEQLKKSLRKKIKKGTNIVVYQGHGNWFLARACAPPGKLSSQEGNHTQLRTDNEIMCVVLSRCSLRSF